MIDVTEQINSVDRAGREPDARGRRGPHAHDLARLRHAARGPVGRVHERRAHPALVPAGLRRPAAGGRFEFEGNARGTIERCDPPHAFDATWEYGGAVSWIEVRLTPERDDRTRFELDHIAHIDDEIWAQYGPGAVGVGWDGAVMGLTRHLGGAEGLDAEAVRPGRRPRRAAASTRAPANAGPRPASPRAPTPTRRAKPALARRRPTPPPRKGGSGRPRNRNPGAAQRRYGVVVLSVKVSVLE